MGTDIFNGSPSTPVAMSMDSTISIIELAKQDVKKSQKTLMSRQNSAMRYV